MSEKKGFASWLFGKKKGAEEAPAEEPGVERLGSPLAGKVIGIEQVSDQVFADKILGDGVAVIPADGKVYAPADGTVENLLESHHAVCLLTPGGAELLDMPGVLWPKFEDPLVGERLAFTGAVKDEIIDTQLLAMRLLAFLKDNGYAKLLAARYKLEESEIAPLDGYRLLLAIGKKRGMLLPGWEIDLQRAASTVLDEYRGGKLGRITLETPEKGDSHDPA